MSVVIHFRVPASAFILAETLTDGPGIRVRLDRAVPLEERFVPYLWVRGTAVDRIEAALQSEVDLAAFQIVDTVDDQALVRVEWDRRVDGLLAALEDTGGRILDAVGEAGEWSLTVRFETHDDLSRFYRECAERGFALTVDAVQNPGIGDDTVPGFGLTDAQRETLLTALREGYFEVPRRKTMVELAAQLGISDTAFSERLRRALSTLLGATLLGDPSTGRTTDEREPAEDGESA